MVLATLLFAPEGYAQKSQKFTLPGNGDNTNLEKLKVKMTTKPTKVIEKTIQTI